MSVFLTGKAITTIHDVDDELVLTSLQLEAAKELEKSPYLVRLLNELAEARARDITVNSGWLGNAVELQQKAIQATAEIGVYKHLLVDLMQNREALQVKVQQLNQTIAARDNQ